MLIKNHATETEGGQAGVYAYSIETDVGKTDNAVQTSVCPKCMIDSVIGDAAGVELSQGQALDRSPRPAA